MGLRRIRPLSGALTLVRSERYSAGLLLGAAALAVILANTAVGPALEEIRATELVVPFTGFGLSVGHWISDGLLAVFFFIVAVELRHELAAGELNGVRRALGPALAALGGVVAPAVIFLTLAAGSGLARGWPVPTATDIAFSLGVLAVFGRGIPNQVRIFLMALAVLDDLVGIVIIAVGFVGELDAMFLLLAALAVAVFGLLSRLWRPGRHWLIPVMIVCGIAAWCFMANSGVHATIAGVALGMVMSRAPASAAAQRLTPVSNGLCLPLFAFSAALVAVPAVSVGQLSPAFWGILIGLPVGKFIGITIVGWLLGVAARRRGERALSMPNVMTVALLGGIGFTVSLLMNQLAFARMPEVVDEGTIAVLLGSAFSIVVSAIVVSLRARHYRRLLAEHP